jgi:hypothetical protein
MPTRIHDCINLMGSWTKYWIFCIFKLIKMLQINKYYFDRFSIYLFYFWIKYMWLEYFPPGLATTYPSDAIRNYRT